MRLACCFSLSVTVSLNSWTSTQKKSCQYISAHTRLRVITLSYCLHTAQCAPFSFAQRQGHKLHAQFLPTLGQNRHHRLLVRLGGRCLALIAMPSRSMNGSCVSHKYMDNHSCHWAKAPWSSCSLPVQRCKALPRRRAALAQALDKGTRVIFSCKSDASFQNQRCLTTS